MDLSDEDIFQLLEPLAAAWMSPDENNDGGTQGPYSHSLVVLFNTNMNQVNNGCKLVTGFVPGMEVVSYSVYDDKGQDQTNWKKLQRSMKRISESHVMWTVPAEGDIRKGKACFGKESAEKIARCEKLLDPNGLFRKK